MTRTRHVVVVGGGIIGLCTAYYVMRRGHRVTVIERGAPDHDSCSLGSAGMIVPSHFVPLAAPGIIRAGLRMLADPESPFSLRPRPSADLLRWGLLFALAATPGRVARAAPLLRDLSLASRRAYEALAADLGDDFGLTLCGLLALCRTPRALHEEARTARQACALGVPAELLTPEEAARAEPGVRLDIAGAVLYPLDAHLTPGRLAAALTAALTAGGADFRWRTDATGWRVREGRVIAVATSSGELAADEYVLAGGAWSPQTVRGLGLRLPVQAGKGYSITLPHPRKTPSLCALLAEARVAVTPMGGDLRFGGTLEISGLDTSVSRRRVDGILKAIPRYLPDFTPDDFRGLPVWSGLRPCSPDGLPYVGRFGRYANLSAATGHAMMGLSLGPVTGRMMAAVLSGESPDCDIRLLSPDRYG